MTDIQLVLLIIGAILYVFIGVILTLVDTSNGYVPTPRDWYNDGYNWFGSYIIFIGRILFIAPFYIGFTVCRIICRFVHWLLTAGR